MKRTILYIFTTFIFLLGISACSGTGTEAPATQSAGSGGGMMGGMGPSSGMMDRHHAAVPEAYASLKNSVAGDDESLERGGELYAAQCATCHGDGGMGDGPAGSALDPAPAPIAHTSQMLGDGHLFWRISDGGAPFGSAMPAFGTALDEENRWDLINYVRALGSGEVMPMDNMGGEMFDPAAEAAKHEEMTAEGVAQGLITEEEAANFILVHAFIDTEMAAGNRQMGAEGTMFDPALEKLVAEGTITQAQADSFANVHQILLDAGLME